MGRPHREQVASSAPPKTLQRRYLYSKSSVNRVLSIERSFYPRNTLELSLRGRNNPQTGSPPKLDRLREPAFLARLICGTLNRELGKLALPSESIEPHPALWFHIHRTPTRTSPLSPERS
jgi:hypothetical protein